MSDNLSIIEKILENSKIHSKTKAVLLLKLCLLSRMFMPESFDGYWAKLQPMKDMLPENYQKDYDSLQKALEPHKQVTKKGFVADTITKIVEAANNKENETIILNECEKDLRKKWWKGGKSSAWIALINAWLPIDRKNSIRLLKKVNDETQKDFLLRWNEEKSLKTEEWDDVIKIIGSTHSVEVIIEEILTKSESEIQIPEKIAKKVGSGIKSKLITTGENQDEKKELQAFKNYISLVTNVEKYDSQCALTLMKDLYQHVAKSYTLFGEKFLEGFSMLAKVINNWIVIKNQQDEAIQYIEEITPLFLKDFALSQWYGNLPDTADEVPKIHKLLIKKVSSRLDAECNFFVLLIARKLFQPAFELAKKSPDQTKLMRCLTRAMLLEFPEDASAYITKSDPVAEPLEYFYMLSNTDERIEYLRQLTSKGTKALPEAYWRQPSYDDSFTNKNKDSLYDYYMKDTEKTEMFKVFVGLHRHQFYSHGNFDNMLMVTLMKWHDKHADEANMLIGKMWEKMKPGDTFLRLDLYRNSIFERCRNVFCASPDKLSEFIAWINNKLVKNSFQFRDGDMMYTLSLKKETLFLYCILSAQKIAKYSAKKCDDIILYGMKNFVGESEYNENLVKAAAEIYSSDKGLSALQHYLSLPGEVNKSWGIGIVEANLTRLAQEMIVNRVETATTG